MPTLWLMTDERIARDDLVRAAQRLPRGSGVIVRHYRTPVPERLALFAAMRRIARQRGLVLLLAAEDAEAARLGADGAHGRSHDRVRRPGFIRTAPVHDRRELRRAERSGADGVFLSPLRTTRSHPGSRPLGAARFAAIARAAAVPVMALGGMGRRHRLLVRRLGASGMGAIDGLTL